MFTQHSITRETPSKQGRREEEGNNGMVDVAHSWHGIHGMQDDYALERKKPHRRKAESRTVMSRRRKFWVRATMRKVSRPSPSA